MVTLSDAYMGRKTSHFAEWSEEIEQNLLTILPKINRLLNTFYAEHPGAATRVCTSGWRPPSVNAETPRAGRKSHHMTGHAIDVSDDDGRLDAWLTDDILAVHGLYREHPAATARYCHLQDVPPGSGRRTFYP